MMAGTVIFQKRPMKVWREGRMEIPGMLRKRRRLETGRPEASVRG